MAHNNPSSSQLFFKKPNFDKPLGVGILPALLIYPILIKHLHSYHIVIFIQNMLLVLCYLGMFHYTIHISINI